MRTAALVNGRAAVRVLGSASPRADAEDHRRASSRVGGRGGKGGPGGRRPEGGGGRDGRRRMAALVNNRAAVRLFGSASLRGDAVGCRGASSHADLFWARMRGEGGRATARGGRAAAVGARRSAWRAGAEMCVVRGSRDARSAAANNHQSLPFTQRQRHVRQQDASRVFPANRMRWMRGRQPCAENRVLGRVARGHALAGRVAGACRRDNAGILGWLRDLQGAQSYADSLPICREQADSPTRVSPGGRRRSVLVLERAVAWTRLGVRVTRGRQPRRQQRGWRICIASWGAGETATNTMCT